MRKVYKLEFRTRFAIKDKTKMTIYTLLVILKTPNSYFDTFCIYILFESKITNYQMNAHIE